MLIVMVSHIVDLPLWCDVDRYRIYRYLNVLHFHIYGMCDTLPCFVSVLVCSLVTASCLLFRLVLGRNTEAIKPHQEYFSNKLVAVGLLTEAEKELMDHSSSAITTLYDLIKKAIEDAEDDAQPTIVKVGVLLGVVVVCRLWHSSTT